MWDNIQQQKMKQCHAQIYYTLYVGLVCLQLVYKYTFIRKVNLAGS